MSHPARSRLPPDCAVPVGLFASASELLWADPVGKVEQAFFALYAGAQYLRRDLFFCALLRQRCRKSLSCSRAGPLKAATSSSTVCA
jgi:hypothetical protein